MKATLIKSEEFISSFKVRDLQRNEIPAAPWNIERNVRANEPQKRIISLKLFFLRFRLDKRAARVNGRVKIVVTHTKM